MNALLIDDTRLARQELKFLLKDFPEVNIIGEASNAEEARSMIQDLNPDLIFLDIQMPEEDGFDLLESLDETPEVIFVTAYNEYAMKAFDFNALDYLQKPVNGDRLKTTLEKVADKISYQNTAKKKILGQDSQVFVKDGEKCWFVTLRNIRVFEIMGNYTRIHFEEVKPMIPKTLNYMESRLDPESFFRANRQQIINTHWIERVEPWFSGSIRIYLKDGSEIEVSRRQTSKFKDLMGF